MDLYNKYFFPQSQKVYLFIYFIYLFYSQNV